jgi:hypothetical protein
MSLQQIGLCGTRLPCFLGFGIIGGLLGWALHGHPTLAALTLGLVIVGDGLVWWK